MYFPGEYYKVLYIIVSINLITGNDMDSGHYVCDVLDYNTGTWWNCDDDTITKYSGYPKMYMIIYQKIMKKRKFYYYEWIR